MSDKQWWTAIRVAAERLRRVHYDGTGCGDPTSSGACSNCYGPSPMSAEEIVEEVLRVLSDTGLLVMKDAKVQYRVFDTRDGYCSLNETMARRELQHGSIERRLVTEWKKVERGQQIGD